MSSILERESFREREQKRQEDLKAAIPLRHTLELVNIFAINTTQFLNRFATVCEDKLNQVQKDIQRLEITLNILEAKLNSIEGIDAAPAPTQQQQQSAAPGAPGSSGNAPPAPPPPPGSGPTVPHDIVLPDVPAEAPKSNVLLCKEDPRLAPYFKLLRIGVPVPNIKAKMEREGFDPDLLDTPDEPSPLGPVPEKEESDDDETEGSDDDDDD